MIGCVDLWEAGQLCLSGRQADGEIYGISLEVEQRRAAMLETEADLWKRRVLTYGIIGVVGWGLAVAFLSAWLSQ
jgi:hypothetical protein